MPDNGTPNLLVHEKSPYLLQHAYNPVQWHPWTMDAFSLARSENKPVFVSIGYATCHWCHVMEHESFENEQIADYLNTHFVSIKVDREERPDIDGIYMDVCQAMTGHGGWPLTVFMDAEQRPFVAGTYFPPTSRSNRIGFFELLQRIHHAWTTDRERIDASSAEVINSLQDGADKSFRGAIPGNVFDILASHHQRTFDEVHGGFGQQPKFPSPHHLLVLFRMAKRTGDTELIRMATATLDAMRAGGIFDHVGGGFHRYSTDRAWLLPHFEKMLYDQAMLMMAYTEAWQITGAERYQRVVNEIADFLRRDLTSSEGAFYSAQDADSEGEEGKYYTWTLSELRDLLAPSQVELLQEMFGVREEGNVHDEATGAVTGANLLHCTRTTIETKAVPAEWETIRTTLLEVRGRRVPPITDDKILTDWNGLMIGALARAGRAVHDDALVSMAERAYRAIVSLCGGTSWVHRYRDGHRHVAAFLDDHAAIGWAAAELYQSTGDVGYLDDARAHADTILTKFRTEHGTLALTSSETADLPVRPREGMDSAYPCGNSMAAWLFAALGAITSDDTYRDAGKECVASNASQLEQYAPGFCMLLSAWDVILHGATVITFHGSRDEALIRSGFEVLASTFAPSSVFDWKPRLEGHEPSIMICTNDHCEPLITTISELNNTLMRGVL